MNNNYTKKYVKFNLFTFFFIFLFSYSCILNHKVNADYETTFANEIYNTALKAITEKFFFKSNLNSEKWETKFKNKIVTVNDAHKYITKLTKELGDPYTRFLSYEEFKDEQDIMKSSFIGVGVKLALNKPQIIDVIPDSPADREGIKPYDYITRINNKNTFGLTPSQITKLLRGEQDTQLEIKVKRGDQTITKTLKREELNFKVVSSKILDNNIALVKIDSFIPENTSKLFKEELTRLMSANGLIIDLRNNSGGLLKNAVEIADMFLSEGKIVSTTSYLEKKNQYANSTVLYDSPVVILVNENTASASEILTSALRENNKAIIIGKRTYGKGLVQEIIKLPDDSALHVTIGAYLTPSGKNINKSGIIPDELIISDEEQIQEAKEILISNRNKDISRIALR
jgi:carboxyl-terminal processing protease